MDMIFSYRYMNSAVASFRSCTFCALQSWYHKLSSLPTVGEENYY